MDRFCFMLLCLYSFIHDTSRHVTHNLHLVIHFVTVRACHIHLSVSDVHFFITSIARTGGASDLTVASVWLAQ